VDVYLQTMPYVPIYLLQNITAKLGGHKGGDTVQQFTRCCSEDGHVCRR
jgi:hypothetical protein